MPASGGDVLTIGHSTHALETFVELLQRHGVTAVADVRAAPYSRFNPQFNREPLAGSLVPRGIAYVFLGSELGGRSDDPSCYENGRISYARLRGTPSFQTDGLLLERPERRPPERVGDVMLKGGVQALEPGFVTHGSSSMSSGPVTARALRSTSVSSPSVRVKA